MTATESPLEAPPAPGVDGTAAREWIPYVAPMALFLALTFAEGKVPEAQYPAFYALKAVVVTVALALCARRWRGEIRPEPRVLLPALAVGLLVFAEWVWLDKLIPYPHFGTRTAYDPFEKIADPTLRAGFLAVRLYGLAVMVPLMEEVFWRSWLLRFVTDQEKWPALPVGAFSTVALVVMSGMFAAAHPEWLVAAVCAVAYALLLRRTRSLFAVIVAHAVTNLTLGVYVLLTGDWKYW